MADAYVIGMAATTPNAHFGWDDGAAAELAIIATEAGAVAQPVDWFDAKRHLAGIKHRYLSETTRYSLGAALHCLRQTGSRIWHGTDEERRGLFLGTAIADYVVRHELDQAVMEAGANALNTVSAPNISANIAAAYLAIACRSRAYATTLTSPFLAGFESLFFGAQALRLQRSDAVLSVAAEEALPEHDEINVLPGAVAFHLAAQPEGARRRIAATAWGHMVQGHSTPPREAQRFIDAISACLGGDIGDARWALLRDYKDLSAQTAERWSGWLAAAGLAQSNRHDDVLRCYGTVEPLLRAAPLLMDNHPVVIVAMQQHRYLAFMLTN